MSSFILLKAKFLDIELAFLLLLRISQLWAFPTGPPLSVCETMAPFHGNSQPQSGVSPFSISVSSFAYTVGAKLTVTIAGSDFKGFLLQARGSSSSVAWPVGEFTNIPNDAQNIFCSGGDPKSTVGHNNPNKTAWSSRQFEWTAPAKSAGDIFFTATIVVNFTTYWKNVTSRVITGPPAESVERGVPTQSFQINKNGCGTTKGCYSLPSACNGSADCNYLFTYQVSGENVVIELSAKKRWVSVAFNEKQKMDKMDSIMCATMATNLAELRHYYASDHHMHRQILAGNSDITLDKIVNEDGGIKCRLSRNLTSNTAHFRNLTEKWYIIFASGPTTLTGSAGYHGSEGKTFTPDMVNLAVPATLVDEQSKVTDTINKNGCGTTKSCYSEPTDCEGSSDCNYLVTIKPEAGEIEFEISSKKGWAAIGFNSERKMDGTDALICADVNGQVTVEHYVADKGYGQPTKTTPKPSITQTLAKSEGGVVSCRFKRNKQDPKMVDLTEKWYLVFASGPMSGDAIGKHTDTPERSAKKVAVDEIGDLSGKTKDNSSTNAYVNKDGCGKTKSCYSEPTDCKGSSDCNYLVTIKPLKGEAREIEFEISSKKEWAAIGFSSNKKMSGTDALICADVNGQVTVEHYVADKGYGPPTKTTPKPSITQTLAKSEGGVVSCRFKRKEQDSNMVDLTKKWYLVYASGGMSGDTIGKHTLTPKTSPEKVAVDEIGVLGGEEKDNSLMKAHACLMVIAWIGFASVGIFMARFMKMAFGDKNLLGTKVWFTFHRGLMVSTVLITIIAVILIFVYAGHWVAGAHPITGIIVLALAIIQPIMALFRCHPGEENRYIFNWAHRGVGLIALVMAVVTVFLGIFMDEVGLDKSPLYALIVYCVVVALVVVFDIYLCLRKTDQRQTKASFTLASEKEAMARGTTDDGQTSEGVHVELQPSADQSVSIRRMMLGFIILFVFCIVIALIVLIAKAEGKEDHH